MRTVTIDINPTIDIGPKPNAFALSNISIFTTYNRWLKEEWRDIEKYST
jgi:hypothetical protein